MGSKPEAGNSQNKQRLLQTKERKKKKKQQQQQLHTASSQLLETDDKFNKVEEENRKKKSMGKKKRKREEGNNIDAGNSVQTIIASDNSFNRLQDKLIKEEGVKKKKNKSSRKKKRESENKFDEAIGNSDQPDTEIEDCSDKKIDDGAINPNQSETPDKSKKSRRNKKKNHTLSKNGGKELHSNREPEPDEVYNISSEDEDFSNGMKKWIMEYHQSRPGLKVLQQRIDDFITAHEEKQELERKEREAHAAEGGWTVVVHHKGRKKTTDSESGIVVGSVAQAAVEDKMVKKKSKEVGLDFYRFQRREAQRNEIMMLQSKFEQDKKRIQQLRAARKFRPY